MQSPENCIKVKVNKFVFSVPRKTAHFLHITDEAPKHLGLWPSFAIERNGRGQVDLKVYNDPDEPSTIYTQLPVERPADSARVEPLDYFPSYGRLSPSQRWRFLDWLQDVKQTIDVGLVFVYYYGLENHLLKDDFVRAFEEVRLLRQHHKNVSFQGYSFNSLFFSALERKDFSRVEMVLKEREGEPLDNLRLLAEYMQGRDLNSDLVFSLAAQNYNVNRRYVKLQANFYREELEMMLRRRYGQAYFPFAAHYKLEDIPQALTYRYANYSLSNDIRTTQVPEFVKYVNNTAEMRDILDEVHQAVKQRISNARRAK
jgi:hypothetical protein